MRVHRARNAWFRAGSARTRVPGVTDIIDEVRERGDAAVLDFTERFDHAELAPDQLLVDPNELESAVGVLESDVLNGLRTAISEREGGREGTGS